MTQTEFADVIQFLAALTVLLGFSSWAWRSILIDSSRNRYFVLRNRLFLMAAQRRIEFSNPAYKNLRNHLDWKIRRVDLPTIGMLITVILHTKVLRSSFQPPYESQRMDHEIDKIEDESVKHDLREIQNAAAAVDTNYILFPSPALYILVSMFAPLLVAALFLPLLALKLDWISAWQKNMLRIGNFWSSIIGADSDRSVHAHQAY